MSSIIQHSFLDSEPIIDAAAEKRRKMLAKKAEYRAAHREELRQKANDYYRKNKARVLERDRQWRINNPEKQREKKKRDYQAHRDHYLRKSHEWRLANPDRKRESNHRWYMKNRDHVHELSRKWRATNLARKRFMDRQWFERNRQKVYNQSRTHEHRRRAIFKTQHYQWGDWIAMCNWFGGVCLHCGSADPLTIDHVIPLAWGGANLIENLQPLCKFCNISKNAHHATDYRDPEMLAAFLHSIGH